VDNIKVSKFPDLTGYLATKRPGDTVNLLLERKNDTMTVPITLKKRQKLNVPVMGMEVKNLTKSDMKKFNTKKGVKITGVPESFRGYGLYGKVIVQVDDKEIKDIEDAHTAFGAITRYGKAVITMLNEKGERERIIFQ
jgi:hypothetical protein